MQDSNAGLPGYNFLGSGTGLSKTRQREEKARIQTFFFCAEHLCFFVLFFP
jgi:hypothetical protein